MAHIDLRSRSVWMDVEVDPGARPLTMDASADVVVVGSGIAGLSTAYELVRRGHKVIVIDRGLIAGGMTARTTAHLAPICDDSLSGLISARGRALALSFQKSQEAAVDRIEQIQRDERIDCHFRRCSGVLFLGARDDVSTLDEEEAAAGELGVICARETGLPFQALEDAPLLRYAAQATFHPLLYLKGLVAAIRQRGGAIHSGTCMAGISETSGGVVVRTSEGPSIAARHAVIATNTPIHDWPEVHAKQTPYRTYAMAFEIGRSDLPDALFWDTEDPYHYVRRLRGAGEDDVVIVGGEDHKTGEVDDAADRFAKLEAWIRGLIPTLGSETHRWSGQVMDTGDYCGFIGLTPGFERVYAVTGDSGQGITHGVVASRILPALIAGEEVADAGAYDPGRQTASIAARLASRAAETVAGLAATLAPAATGGDEQLGPGEGAVVDAPFGKKAVYRTEAGALLEHSASCTHEGCELSWNSFEKTWDCGCHGSHFSPDGIAINAPAISKLGAAGS